MVSPMVSASHALGLTMVSPMVSASHALGLNMVSPMVSASHALGLTMVSPWSPPRTLSAVQCLNFFVDKVSGGISRAPSTTHWVTKSVMHIIPLAKWDDAKRQPSSSEDAGVMYYYPLAGLFLIPEGPWIFYAPDLVCLRTPTILEQYLMSTDTSCSSHPLIVRSTRRLERVIESYTENISKKYRFSLDRAGQHTCLIVINQNKLSYPFYNDSSYHGFNFIYLTMLRSSTYFTKNPCAWTAKNLHDASDVWLSKYHVDCINPRIAKLKSFIVYSNVYSRLLRIADPQSGGHANANTAKEDAVSPCDTRNLAKEDAVSPCDTKNLAKEDAVSPCDTRNLLSALPREILSKIAWMAVLSSKSMIM
jgi:hypothetical protein